MQRHAVRKEFFLISRRENGRTEMLAANLDGGGTALLVFGFEEEAAMFLWLETLGTAWRVRRTSAGELISLLHDPCGEFGRVALDPLPRACCGLETNFVSREDLARTLVREKGFRVPPGMRPRSAGSAR